LQTKKQILMELFKALTQDLYWLWWVFTLPLAGTLIYMGRKDKRFYIGAVIFIILFIILAGIGIYHESTS